MDRYRSPGVATIAALMAPDGDARQRPQLCPTPPMPRCPAMVDLSRIGRRCERSVVTAYCELRAYGADDLAAFRACTALYRIHHPEASPDDANRLVAEWIDHHLVRGDTSPAPGCKPARTSSARS